jgi:DNA-binding XRE family transcriptional regulator
MFRKLNTLQGGGEMGLETYLGEAKVNLLVGMRLKHIREAHDLSQGKMADKLYLSRVSYNQIENGNRPLTDGNLIELMKCFPDSKDKRQIDEICVLLGKTNILPEVQTMTKLMFAKVSGKQTEEDI